MTEIACASLRETLARARDATKAGPPAPPSNPYFGVGPITDGTHSAAESAQLNALFERWLEQEYRQKDDRGLDLRGFTAAELGQCMHRGYPADKVILDMMRQIHRYFEFPSENHLAVGLGGGHSGFTSCVLHLMSAREACHVFIDTPEPESDAARGCGFFRQSWAEQIIDIQRHAKTGDVRRVHFAGHEGEIPDADWLSDQGIQLFIGVGHETTGATTYSEADVRRLLDWLERDPRHHHALLDATSLLGAMPWSTQTVRALLRQCCFFSPLQKAIGGIAGYFVASFTPAAMALMERNQLDPSWAIPRQLRLSAPRDRARPLTGGASVYGGPFYSPAEDRMLGGVINTFSTLAFARTTFGLVRTAQTIGNVTALNQASIRNRAAIEHWVVHNPLFELVVATPERRGAAVTLLRVNDADVGEGDQRAIILAKAKGLLGYEGLTFADGTHEPGLRAAYYINAFPGTPGDFRAWVGGIRSESDVIALLENLQYAWLRAKVAVLEPLLDA